MQFGLTKRSRQVVSAIVALMTLGMGAVLPLLDTDSLDATTAIESDHHQACQLAEHDHSICIQFGNQRWASVGRALPAVHSPDERYQLGHPNQPVRGVDRSRPDDPRAPPLRQIL
jgi:hypothetical protein